MSLDDDLNSFNINIDVLLERYPQLDEYFIQSALLSAVIHRILKRRGKIELSNKPTYHLRPVTEFMKKMRVSSLEKFEMETHISSINFYVDEEHLENHAPLGTLIIYIGEDYILPLLRKLQYLSWGEELAEEEYGDAVGTICNLIAGKFKEGLVTLGYKELIMSHFSSYRNSALNGVEYNTEVKELYEISYEIDGEKQIMAEVCFGEIPRAALY